MKKALAVLMAVMLALCAGAAEAAEIIVFAAASLTEALTEIGTLYRAENPEIALVFNFDSSGTLKTQIEEGAACDIFISAGQKQMDALGAMIGDSRVDLLENNVVLTVPADNPRKIGSFDDLASRLRESEILLALGNADVPVGQYTQRILAYYGLDEAALARAGKLTYGGNVKEVVTQVSEGSADCGVVYATDARSAGLEIIDTATEAMCGRVIYPAAVMKDSAEPAAARAFLDYLRGPKAAAVFENIGFSPIAP